MSEGESFVSLQLLLSRASGAAIALSLLVSAPALAQAPAAAPKTANGWGVSFTDVTPDPSIVYGTLPNGMKYAIMRNATPQGTASVRLRFGFGSIGESEKERGLAHFIEHMAFNGTTHVHEGDMVKILQRQGLAFGPDTNAITDFDTTTYMLELPKTDAEHIDTAMFLLREVAGEVKFAQAAVDRERGVILGEERARDTYQLHQVVDQLGFDVPETPYPNRIPIGLDSVLNSASSAALQGLYHRYYRPENATLLFVGDADPTVVEAKIKSTFGDWKSVGPAGAPLPRGKVDFARPAAFHTFVDPAVPTIVDYTVARSWDDPADTVAERQHKMLQVVAVALLNRRFQKLANTPNSPILGGGMMTPVEKDAARLTTVKVMAKDAAWKEAVQTADQEVRRALQFGFTPAELKVVLAELSGGMIKAAHEANTRTNASLVNALLASVGENDFVTTPQYRLEQYQQFAKTITPEKVNAAFRELWTGSAPLVHLSTNQPVPTAELASAFAASRAMAVVAPVDSAVQRFAYDSFGTPGKIAADTRVADLGLRTIRFANNVKLNIKKTDFEAARVRFMVRLGDGVLDLPMDKPGLGAMMSMTSSIGAVKKHSVDELKELAAGKAVTLGTLVTDKGFIATGVTTPGDLALQMKISAAYLLDPGFRPEAASQWANVLPIFEKQLDAQPQSVAQARLPILLAGGDQRFGVPETAVLSRRNFDEAKAALAPVISSAPIEITIVGDVDEQAAINAVAATFGALPQRKLSEAPSAAALKVSFRPDRTPIQLTHDGAKDQALVEVAWATTDDSDFRREMGLNLLKDVMDVMLTDSVREKLGDSYGVGIQSHMSEVFPGFGYLAANAVVAPDKRDEVIGAIEAAAQQLRDKPVDRDLLNRARNPELEKIDHALRDNGFWLASLAEAQSQPDRLQRIRERRQILTSITPAELQKLAQTYLQPARMRQATIVSSKLETSGSKAASR